ncbi:MAG: TlpA family protein disulfide reductase [Anaerolineae bacterium]|nr:TlpA family protein disulfide reductase [Anaerolineae bacterium]
MRRFLPVLCLLGFLMLAGCRATQQESVAAIQEPLSPPTLEHPLAADFQLTTLDGDTVSLQDYRGKVVLLNFWATWCPACRSEMASLELYYQAHQAEGLVVLGVNYQEDSNSVASFVADAELSFPVLLDTAGKTATAYGVVGLPASYFVGCRGELLGFWPGAVSASLLEQHLTPYLGECPETE